MSASRSIRPSDAPQARRRADPVLRRAGFSMVEVVVVLVVMTVVAGIALPRYFASLGRYRVDMAARRLATDLALAQSRARTTGTFRNVKFSNGGLTYTIAEERSLSGSGPGYTVSMDQDPFGVVVNGLVISDAGSTVTFDGFGQPAQSLRIQLAGGPHTRTVTVDQSTGAINVATP